MKDAEKFLTRFPKLTKKLEKEIRQTHRRYILFNHKGQAYCTACEKEIADGKKLRGQAFIRLIAIVQIAEIRRKKSMSQKTTPAQKLMTLDLRLFISRGKMGICMPDALSKK